MTRMTNRLLAAALVIAGLVLAPLACAFERPPKLVVGLLPGESAPTVMRLNEPLRAYLEQKLKMPVELVVGANYAATSEALRFGRLDIAYLGPVTYILQSRRVPLEPFARPSHAGAGPTFRPPSSFPPTVRQRPSPTSRVATSPSAIRPRPLEPGSRAGNCCMKG